MYTLLQRLVRDELLTRVFGVVFAVAVVGLGGGSIAAPALVAAFGVRGALIATGSFLVVATLLAWRRLVAIDVVAVPPTRELSLLSAVPLCTIRREDFLGVVTGHPAVRAAGEAVVRERLATPGEPAEPLASPKR